jgi:diadenosine tetraphosphatase ApaH/serine/threonine PP2A family protein phosphatase
MSKNYKPMEAGSLQAIVYVFFQLLDEILHGLDRIPWIGNAAWRFRFCQWCYRGNYHEDRCHECVLCSKTE